MNQKNINLLPNANVMVVGDVMLDRYWQGETSRISPEAPVPVVQVHETHDLPGGAGNVALNIAALGAKVSLLGVVGDDLEGRCLAQALQEKQVENFFTIDNARPTTTKLRLMSQHQQLIRIDFEKNDIAYDITPVLNEYAKQLLKVNAVILSDYAKGLLVDPQPFIKLARQQKVPILVDPKSDDFQRYRGATMITPNFKEFQAVVGQCATETQIIERARDLIGEHQLQALLITRGAKGMTLVEKNKPEHHFPAAVHEVFDVTGAGDTVIALIASSLSVGIPLTQAVEIANTAAGYVVTKLGAASISVSELRREFAKRQDIDYGVVNDQQLQEGIQAARAQNETIVMTNGCFDLLHVGHVKYLQAAKSLGDRLIIAVNDDQSVKRLKGPKRPINPLARRMEVLAALSFVDWVVPFSEDTPFNLIQALQPDILVKGGDYRVEDVVGGDIVQARGGRVEIIEYQPGLSTTNLINQIVEGEV